MMFCCEYSEVLCCLLCYVAAVAVLHSAVEKYFPLGGHKSPSFVYQQKHCNRINMIEPVHCFVDLIFIH